jgi:hypothetical protein
MLLLADLVSRFVGVPRVGGCGYRCGYLWITCPKVSTNSHGKVALLGSTETPLQSVRPRNITILATLLRVLRSP